MHACVLNCDTWPNQPGSQAFCYMLLDMRWHTATDNMQSRAGHLMVGAAKPEQGHCSPTDAVCCGDKTPAATHAIYIPVSDFEAAYRRAQDAGATITREPYTTTFGSRNFVLTDPEGGKW